MTGLFNRVSRKSRRLSRALVVFAVVMSAALAVTWPATGKARQDDCGVNFVVNGAADTQAGSIDCETALTKAGKAAMQNVRYWASVTGCPASCPTLVEVTAPYVLTYSCSPRGSVWFGSATAQGVYRCQ